jgi:hypothetical protein
MTWRYLMLIFVLGEALVGIALPLADVAQAGEPLLGAGQ